MSSKIYEPKNILKKLEDFIIKNESPDKSKILVSFMKSYFNMISSDDLDKKTVQELYFLLKSHWDFLHSYLMLGKENHVKVFNYDIEDKKESKLSHLTHSTFIQVVFPDMPFLVDSLSNELVKLNLINKLMIYPGGLWFQYDQDLNVTAVLRNKVKNIKKNNDNYQQKRLALIYIEVNKQFSQDDLNLLKNQLENILYDVNLVVSDWKKMQLKALESCEILTNIFQQTKNKEIIESQEFVTWLANGNFTFLGCCDYKDEYLPESGLGLFSSKRSQRLQEYLSVLPIEAGALCDSEKTLIIGKMRSRSPVHRRVYMDYVGVKLYSEEHQCDIERRFVGLYTSGAYNNSPLNIPLLRNKVTRILQKTKFLSDSHAAKAFLNILETLPRDDLFQATERELYKIAIGIFQIQERPIVRLFIRKDYHERYCSCLLYIPKEIYNAEVRKKVSDILRKHLHGDEINFSTRFTESILARIHFYVRAKEDTKIPKFSLKKIEEEIVNATKTWQQGLYEKLIHGYGDQEALYLFKKYCKSFPVSYTSRYSLQIAIQDISIIEVVNNNNLLRTSLYQKSKDSDSFILKAFKYKDPLLLTDIMPILENLGMTVIGENSFEVTDNDYKKVWIHEFEIFYNNNSICNLDEVKDDFQSCFYNVWYGNAENDILNSLVISAKVGWREIVILRAYAKYLQQISFPLSQEYIKNTLVTNYHVAKKIISLFFARFSLDSTNSAAMEHLAKEIEKSLDDILNLDQDKILRQYLNIILSTLRTNYFQKDINGCHKKHISFKLDSKNIHGIPEPAPKYEIFVYSPDVEGVHLRCGKVSRGGIRWSDRQEDFRTEILGLMKAQNVKNSVIVPSGAKGGFIVKQDLENLSREEATEVVISCYSSFIKGLLDITDNLKDNKIVPPNNVKKLDDDDYYLVVAADKGTASLSDIANKISQEYNFWLGDAFASGGSAGYDHKKMGITALGAWESVKRHFLVLGINTQRQDFTAVGIGDMSGDVFGNGMLLSKHIRLIAAFNHMHIFIDPNPNAATSYKERKRLFNLSRSAWTDYNIKLISKGGGVFSRKSKFIKITPEMKRVFNISQDYLEPNQLIKFILKANYDLLWNGGIGTYVKSSVESNLDVGDKSNDNLRINGCELHCRVVGEGGNLGFTQLGRIEAAQQGIKIFTDFIDNSAGVDCSDHEVNIKILLNEAVKDKKLSLEDRNKLLFSMTDEVTSLVLKNNYSQGESISLATARASLTVEELSRFMEQLERADEIDLDLEFLPSKEKLLERGGKTKGLTSPELAVLLAYSKNILNKELLAADSCLLKLNIFNEYLTREFPQPVVERFPKEILNHSLKREIIATQLSNEIINKMGITYVKRLYDETGAKTVDIVSSHVISANIFRLNNLWDAINKQTKVTVVNKYNALFDLVRLVRRCARWFLRNYRTDLDIEMLINRFKEKVHKLWDCLPNILLDNELLKYTASYENYISNLFDADVADKLMLLKPLYSVLDIIEIANLYKLDVEYVARVYYSLSTTLGLSEFREKLSSNPVDDNWDALARAAIRDDIDYYQREITTSFITSYQGKGEQIFDSNRIVSEVEAWLLQYDLLVKRWQKVLSDLKTATSREFTIYAVAVRELMDLSIVTNQINKE